MGEGSSAPSDPLTNVTDSNKGTISPNNGNDIQS